MVAVERRRVQHEIPYRVVDCCIPHGMTGTQSTSAANSSSQACCADTALLYSTATPVPSPPPGAVVYSQVTVLFSDIVGFTSLSSLWPTQEVVAMLDMLFGAFDDLCDK